MKRTWKSIIALVLVLGILTAPVLARDNTSDLLDKFTEIMSAIQENHYGDVKLTDLMDGAIKGMFSVLDKHSTYFTEEEYQSFSSGISGEFVGIGVYIEAKDDYIQVVSPIEGSPAYNAGIKTGDMILFVDDKDIKGMTTEQASSIIKGAAGTKVHLKIKREGVADLLTFEIIRDTIRINPISYKIMDDNLGYIRITEFNGNVYSNFKKALDEFKSKNVKGIVIDVRNNPGGLLDEVVNICKLLIPKGPVVHIKYKNQPQQTYSSTLAKAPFKIVMLVDEGSASASEIMAGAIKDSGAGKLVGQKTYGKGTVQSIWSLNDGSGMKITVANYLTPSGYSLDGKGIIPDFQVKNNLVQEIPDLSPISGTRSIKQNLVGLDVLGVQQRLSAIGYKISPVDGVFNKSTLTAVQKFQKDNKLKLDNTMDADDIKVLINKFETFPDPKDEQLDRAVTELKKLISK